MQATGWQRGRAERADSCCVPRWNAHLVLYRLQSLPPLQHSLLAGQWLLHRAPPWPATGGQHQVRGMVARPAGGRPPPSVLMLFLLCCSWERRGSITQLRKALVLEELSPALHSTNFSCVFTDPERTVLHHVVLAHLLVRDLREVSRDRRSSAPVWGGEGGLCPEQSVANDHHSPKSPGPR